MYRQEKSHLAYQVVGRLSAYISDIDACEEFSSTSQTDLEQTMEMTECIHSLIGHIKTNCLSDNKLVLDKFNLRIDKSAELKNQYTLTWKPIRNAKTISGFLKISFQTPDIELWTISNFKSDNIESLTNLIIDLTTLTFSDSIEINEKNLIIVKTKGLDSITDDNVSTLKNELETYCGYNKTNPTFLYLKHKDNVGYFHKHFSNYESKQ